MLPTNRKRALQIPHGLAIAAAALCLVLAFSTDLQSRHDQISAERSEPAPVQLLAGSEDSLLDKAGRGDQRAESRTRDLRRAPMPLFPWFPGTGSGGG
ncbi:MAG: hypothetical protein ACXIUM_09420 [Wenzhouxiangella sp.]